MRCDLLQLTPVVLCSVVWSTERNCCLYSKGSNRNRKLNHVLLFCQLCSSFLVYYCWFYYYFIIDSIGCSIYCSSVVLFSYCILYLFVCLSWFKFAVVSHHVFNIVFTSYCCCFFCFLIGIRYFYCGCWKWVLI